MTMQRLTTRVNRAARYLIAGNPKLIMSAADLQEAAQVGKLPRLHLVEPSTSGSQKVDDDPLAVAIAVKAVAIMSDRKGMMPSAEQIRSRKIIMEAAFRRVCRESA